MFRIKRKTSKGNVKSIKNLDLDHLFTNYIFNSLKITDNDRKAKIIFNNEDKNQDDLRYLFKYTLLKCS